MLLYRVFFLSGQPGNGKAGVWLALYYHSSSQPVGVTHIWESHIRYLAYQVFVIQFVVVGYSYEVAIKIKKQSQVGREKRLSLIHI